MRQRDRFLTHVLDDEAYPALVLQHLVAAQEVIAVLASQSAQLTELLFEGRSVNRLGRAALDHYTLVLNDVSAEKKHKCALA